MVLGQTIHDFGLLPAVAQGMCWDGARLWMHNTGFLYAIKLAAGGGIDTVDTWATGLNNGGPCFDGRTLYLMNNATGNLHAVHIVNDALYLINTWNIGASWYPTFDGKHIINWLTNSLRWFNPQGGMVQVRSQLYTGPPVFVADLCFDGKNVWGITGGNNRLWCLNPTGDKPATSLAHMNAAGIAFDGEHLLLACRVTGGGWVTQHLYSVAKS